MSIPGTATFLSNILDYKRAQVAQQISSFPISDLQARASTAPAARDFAAALGQSQGLALIAEVKCASPSKGVLVKDFDPQAFARIYAENGAHAISILTDSHFFQGSLAYLEAIRALPQIQGQAPAARPIPLLRKDFIIDPYQVYEARAYGADALLLIVAALDDQLLAALLNLTHELGMQALVEVHDEQELERALAVGARIIGVNNRNLHTFVTTLETTARIAARLPAQERPLLVSESGITTKSDAVQVHAWGAKAILVGEALVTAQDVAAQVRLLAHALA